MPIFEYRCTKCGKEFEEVVFGEDLPKCPECGAEKTQKLMSCCRHKHGSMREHHGFSAPKGAAPQVPIGGGGGGGCSGCSGGDCSSCG